jgi:hypothetical protein
MSPRTTAGYLEEVLARVLLESGRLEFDELIGHQQRDQRTAARVDGHVQRDHQVQQH